MKASTTGSGRRTARRVAVGAAVLGLAVAGNAAIGLAGDDGRSGGTPGAPTDAPSPVADDASNRSGGAVSNARSTTRAASVSLDAPTDNGRGGVDPDFGPNPVAPQQTRAAAAEMPAGAYDTDSGLAPEPAVATRAQAEPLAPSDQDVPGAPTGAESGPDTPANDQDG